MGEQGIQDGWYCPLEQLFHPSLGDSRYEPLEEEEDEEWI